MLLLSGSIVRFEVVEAFPETLGPRVVVDVLGGRDKVRYVELDEVGVFLLFDGLRLLVASVDSTRSFSTDLFIGRKMLTVVVWLRRMR